MSKPRIIFSYSNVNTVKPTSINTVAVEAETTSIGSSFLNEKKEYTLEDHPLSIPDNPYFKFFEQQKCITLQSKSDKRGILGGRFLTDLFVRSNMFKEVKYDPYFPYGRPANYKALRIKVNDTMCLIDSKDMSWVSPDFVRRANGFFRNVKFIFVLQYAYKNFDFYQKVKKTTGRYVLPLAYISCLNTWDVNFSWNPVDCKYLANGAFATGNKRSHRDKWVKWMKNNGKYYMPRAKRDKYLEVLRRTRWGLSLKGCERGQDGKCFREIEYASLGLPLALNYKPTYPFPFYPNEHYFYIERMEDLNKLETVDPLPFAIKSREVYRNYFCPYGMTQLMLNLIYNKEYRDHLPDFWQHLKK